MTLELDKFSEVVRSAVLVSIDLILMDEQNRVLLGQRTNAPARGYWFVPGGRILKDETTPEAAVRIVKRELGLDALPAPLELQGIYDHIYEDSYFDPSVGTHYVVLACRCRIPSDLPITPDDQHESLQFFSVDDLLASPDVHQYTKNYFRPNPPNLFLR